MKDQYFEVNRASWNHRAELHVDQEFYALDEFIDGKSSLNSIELELLGEVRNLDLIHPMCHFGMDSLSLARMGAKVTGIDLSDKAIEKAHWLSKRINVAAQFIQSNYYDLPTHLQQPYDYFFSSYGVIGWLPDLDKWASIAYNTLRKGGQFLLVEFHPVVWMYDDDFNEIQYNYFMEGVISTNEASYTDKESNDKQDFYSWNHSLSEVFSALLKAGFRIDLFREYDYSPYNCFKHTIEVEKGKFQIEKFGNKIPMVYAIKAFKE